MTSVRGDRIAPGWPGIEPRWTRGNKDGVGTAYSDGSEMWFTLWRGIITEVYYPTIDRPQLRDLQFLLTDGETFFHEERRDLTPVTERFSDHALGYKVTTTDPEGRYSLRKEIISDPHLPCLLQSVRLQGESGFLRRLSLYVLCAPHLEVGGKGNTGLVLDVAGRGVLAAEKGGVWLALAATAPLTRLSCGYVGVSDGWQDLAADYKMDWEYDQAPNGNVALTGQIDQASRDFVVGLAFGQSRSSAVTALLESLATPFEEHRSRFKRQWNRACRNILPLDEGTAGQKILYHGSYSLLMGHEDKTYPGALIASLSIPWGESRGDEDRGGYHLVWTRDLVNSALGLLAAGNTETPKRALIYLAVNQGEDGGFPQNFWIDGTPYWHGVQLDEVAFPILLAWRLNAAGELGDFDPYAMVMRAASYLIRHGPVTQQERWEEASGYSPSTLAATIAALVCAASFARERGNPATARFLEEYADFLECHVESWTVTTEGDLVPGLRRHYLRITPASVDDSRPGEDPNAGILELTNQPPDTVGGFPAKDIVDAGFLELVRYGIRRPDDPLIVDSLRVVDEVLRVETPHGPCWRRYNHDGYGQRADGAPYMGWGQGRAWPLLTGERGHYELAAGRDPTPYLRAMEGFASPAGLLPEQIWDQEGIPEAHLSLGGSTGSAQPLMWAHAEYIRLLRSWKDGRVFDLIPAVAERYLGDRRACELLEVWKHNRQPEAVRRGYTLRVLAPASFRLRWSGDDWSSSGELASGSTGLGFEYVDIPIDSRIQEGVRFSFSWTHEGRWEETEYRVAARDGSSVKPEGH